jgi:hypothetical protein
VNPAPITEFHTCDACGCHYPKDQAEDILLEKLAWLAAELMKCKEKA